MQTERHELTVDAGALQEQLRHVYWIGGGSGAGKSTIARRIAAEHDLQLYATDDVMPDHARMNASATGINCRRQVHRSSLGWTADMSMPRIRNPGQRVGLK